MAMRGKQPQAQRLMPLDDEPAPPPAFEEEQPGDAAAVPDEGAVPEEDSVPEEGGATEEGGVPQSSVAAEAGTAPEGAAEEAGTEEAGESFERLFARLEEISERLEAGGLALEESIALYEEGMRIAARCQAMLGDVEQRIETLRRRVVEDGEER